jgi:ABC-type transport system involved in cytochrome bd biosynthesis fused ATPase/permease subunit
VLEVLDTPLPEGDLAVSPGAATVPSRRPLSDAGPPPTLAVQRLCVEYAQRGAPALDAFSMLCPSGTRIALTGPSGAGKSTVLAALLRFVQPSAGSVLLGDADLAHTDVRQWRAHFSWLPQRPHLFHATMAENLRLGAPDAPDEDLVAVLDAVGLADLTTHLPDGLATVLGHDGLTLSAGERQRVALARALLRPAPILLLDEPTASLDPPTVRRLAPAIEPWLAGRTVLVAAHEPVLLHFDGTTALPVPAASPLVTST